jgi:hypothetical protein
LIDKISFEFINNILINASLFYLLGENFAFVVAFPQEKAELIQLMLQNFLILFELV